MGMDQDLAAQWVEKAPGPRGSMPPKVKEPRKKSAQGGDFGCELGEDIVPAELAW